MISKTVEHDYTVKTKVFIPKVFTNKRFILKEGRSHFLGGYAPVTLDAWIKKKWNSIIIYVRLLIWENQWEKDSFWKKDVNVIWHLGELQQRKHPPNQMKFFLMVQNT